jgi:hypothetical protein
LSTAKRLEGRYTSINHAIMVNTAVGSDLGLGLACGRKADQLSRHVQNQDGKRRRHATHFVRLRHRRLCVAFWHIHVCASDVSCADELAVRALNPQAICLALSQAADEPAAENGQWIGSGGANPS